MERNSQQSGDPLDRLPPQNLDAEKGVLGSILLDPNLCDDVLEVVQTDDFYSDANRKLFFHVAEMRSNGSSIDATLLVERLRNAGELEAVGGMAYLAEVVQSVPVAAHAVQYAQIVKEKALRRRVIHAATSMLRDAYEESAPIDDVVSDCEASLQKIPTGESLGEPVQLFQALIAANVVVDDIALRRRAAGVMTGIHSFDHAIGGLFPGELVLLAARPSVGKTALALQVALHVASKARSAYFASLEMRTTDLALRVLCGQSGVSLARVRAAEVEAADTAQMMAVGQALSGLPIWLHDRPRLGVPDIRRACRRLASKVELSLVVVDYLQRITPADPKAPRHLQVGANAWELKALALELHVPVLCLTQLSRAAEERDKKTGIVREPRMSDLKETGDQEQDADMVLLLHRQQRAVEASLILAKNRQGDQGRFNLFFQKERMLFRCSGFVSEEF
jgi:replicative DNA helicase